MDDDIDIYADLSITESKKETDQITTQNVELEKKILNLENEVKTLRMENDVLNRNISSLLKTAQAEINRKDNVIADLRKQLDNAAFRRGKFQKLPNKNFSNKRDEQTRHSYNNNIKQETHAENKLSAEYTEYFCHSHSHGENNSHRQIQEETFKKHVSRDTENINSDDEGQKYDSSKVYNTLYGDRLRKKLIAEEEEQRKIKDERRLKEEEKKHEDEKQRRKEEVREDERRLKEEEDRKRENEKQRRRDEKRRLEDEEKRYEEEKQKRKDEEKRYREEQLKKKEKEERKLEEEKKVKETYQRKKDDERWKRDEEKRTRDEYQRKKDNERRKKDEEKRREEYPRKKDDEWRKKDEERRYKEEQKKREEERNSQERKVKEIQRKRDEERRRREEERKAREEERKNRDEEQRIQDEERKLKEEKVRLEQLIREENRQQKIAQHIAEVARIRSAELEEHRKKVLENKENHRYSRWPDIQESVESRKAQSVSSEEYAARLMRLNLKRDVDYSNQWSINQDAGLPERQHSDKDVPHDPRRIKKPETGGRRRKISVHDDRSRSPENLRSKRFSPERCKNDFTKNKPHSDYSSRYTSHNTENSRHCPQSHSWKNDDHCRKDRLPDHRRNCRDKNWPDVTQEHCAEDRKRKSGTLDRDSHHILKKSKLAEDESRNDSEGERCTQQVEVHEIESPDELEDGEIASVEAIDIDLHNDQLNSSWDLKNEQQKPMIIEDEESLEKIEQQLKKLNETKIEDHVPPELPKEKFTETQLKNVLETSFELKTPGITRKSPRSRSRSHSRSQSRSQSREKEETKKEQNLMSEDEFESKNTVEPIVEDKNNTKPVEENVSSDQNTQNQLNSGLSALNEETEIEKISKTEQSSCDKSDDLEIEEDEIETKVEADKMEKETTEVSCAEVLMVNDEIKSSNSEPPQVPDHRPETMLSEPQITPTKNHQLPSLAMSTPIREDVVNDHQQKLDEVKDLESLDLNIKLEISISPAQKSTPDKKFDLSEEDKITSNGTVESDSKDKTTTSDKTSSSSSSEMDEDKSSELPQFNISESDAEEPQDNVGSQIVSQSIAVYGASDASNKSEEETNQVPQDSLVTETGKESPRANTKLEDKMSKLFGSEQSHEPSVMFSPVMEVEVETSNTIDSPRNKLEDTKEEGEIEETEDEEQIDLTEPEDKSSFKPQTSTILGSLLQCDKIIKFSRFSSDEIKLGIKLERCDQIWNKAAEGTVAEQPSSFGTFRRRKKVVVSVGKVKKSNPKITKIKNVPDRKEDKVREAIEDLIQEKSNPETVLKKDAFAKKVTVKTEKKGPIVFKRRRPKHLSDSSSCFTVD